MQTDVQDSGSRCRLLPLSAHPKWLPANRLTRIDCAKRECIDTVPERTYLNAVAHEVRLIPLEDIAGTSGSLSMTMSSILLLQWLRLLRKNYAYAA